MSEPRAAMRADRRFPTLVLAVMVAVAGSGCATIVHGRHQAIAVTSDPPGAAVQLNGTSVGTTPATVRVRRRGPAVLELAKDGFAPMRVEVESRTSRWIAGNLVLLNPLAIQGFSSTGAWAAAAVPWFAGAVAVDVLTGGGRVRPSRVSVTLTPRTAGH